MKNTEVNRSSSLSKIKQINSKILRDIAVIFIIGLLLGSVIIYFMYMPTVVRLTELEQEYEVLAIELTNQTVNIENSLCTEATESRGR